MSRRVLALVVIACATHSASGCAGRLDVRLLRKPPFLCRRLASDDCASFFVRVNPSGTRARFSKPCVWWHDVCGAGPRALCGSNSTRRGDELGSTSDPAMDLSLNLELSSSIVGGQAVREAIANAERLRLRRTQRLRKAHLRHLGRPCSSQSSGDKGVAGPCGPQSLNSALTCDSRCTHTHARLLHAMRSHTTVLSHTTRRSCRLAHLSSSSHT